MNIVVYGKTDCGNCATLKTIMEQKGIEFKYVDDKLELMKVGSKARIMSAPIILDDGLYYTYNEYMEVLNGGPKKKRKGE